MDPLSSFGSPALATKISERRGTFADLRTFEVCLHAGLPTKLLWSYGHPCGELFSSLLWPRSNPAQLSIPGSSCLHRSGGSVHSSVDSDIRIGGLEKPSTLKTLNPKPLSQHDACRRSTPAPLQRFRRLAWRDAQSARRAAGLVYRV